MITHPAQRPSHQSPLRRPSAVIVAAFIAVSGLAMSGCYQRVVKAKGLGADSVTVSESYQGSSKVDDWLFGKEEPKSKSLLDR